MRWLIAAGMSALLLTGCATGGDTDPAAAPGGPPSAAPSEPAHADSLLGAYGLAGKSAVEVIDHLDRLDVAQRPADLRASVRPAELVVSAGGEEVSLDIPEDRFYLSVAPYVEQTHDCFHHSLTTCKGELAAAEVQVRIVDRATGKVLVDGTQTTFDNGFVGFWLPRDIEATVRISHAGRTGEASIATDADAPTCLTTLKLA